MCHIYVHVYLYVYVKNINFFLQNVLQTMLATEQSLHTMEVGQFTAIIYTYLNTHRIVFNNYMINKICIACTLIVGDIVLVCITYTVCNSETDLIIDTGE